jgi:outer membrane protein TolC
MKNCSRGSRVGVSIHCLALAVSTAASVMLSGCAEDPLPFNPRDAQAWERSSDAEVKSRRLVPLPTTAETPTVSDPALPDSMRRLGTMNVPEGPPVPMSLQEVIHRTVANNLDIRVASYDTAIDQTRVLEAEANFDPSVFSDLSYQRVDKDTGGVDSTIPTAAASLTKNSTSDFTSLITQLDQEGISTFDFGLRGNLPAGGKIEVKETIVDSYFYPPRSILNPYYQNDLTVQLTQPVLQNFGIAVNRARITIAQNNQRVSLLDFRKTVEDTVLKVEQTYWRLVQTQRDINSVKILVDESEHTTDILKGRFKEDVTAIPLENAIAQTASRKVQLIQLEGQLYDLSDQIKQLMNDPKYPVSSSGVITPKDLGTELPMHFNLDDQIETGLENRLELGQQQVRIDSAEIAVDVARNNLLPQFDLIISTDVDGLSSNLGESLISEGQFNRLGYSAGFQFSYFLGNRAARAVWNRSILQRLQAIVSYGNLVEQVALDVKTAARAVDYTWLRLAEARKATLYFQALVNNEQKQQDFGNEPITSDTIAIRLQNQLFLFSAEQAEHQALNDYNYALANLEHAKGTILRYNNVIMEQAQIPVDLKMK